MLAADYIPAPYQHLPILRLFLPAVDEHERPVLWSSLLLDDDQLTGSSDWNELYERFDAGRPTTDRPQAAMGCLDDDRFSALKSILFPRLGVDALFQTHSWTGYAVAGAGPESSVFNGQEYLHETLPLHQALTRASTNRIPDFGNDLHGAFAWGSNLYPDSLVIAAESEIFKAFFNDQRLEAVSIVKHRDVLPLSSGD